jgi:hypothetical protein
VGFDRVVKIMWGGLGTLMGLVCFCYVFLYFFKIN